MRKLTIAILTHNRKQYLNQAIKAVLNQTYTDFEFLICDNHSTDGTLEMVAGFNDNRITYIRHPEGCNPTYNHGSALRYARFPRLLITHDDDIMQPTMVEKMMNYMDEHPQVITLATNVSLINEDGVKVQDKLYYNMNEDRLFKPKEYLGAYLTEKLWFPTPTYMHNRDVFVEASGGAADWNDPDDFPSGDILNLIRANLNGEVAILAEPLLQYRQHSSQESRNVDQSQVMAELMNYIDKVANKESCLKDESYAIIGGQAKYKLQDELFNNGSGHRSYAEWSHLTNHEGITNIPSLPIGLFGMLSKVYKVKLNMPTIDSNDITQMTYWKWAHRLNDQSTLLNSPKSKNIIIFGSMLTAYLLVLDAQLSGHNIITCIDSSPQRIGKNIFGIPIKPHNALKYLNPDMILLSSERGHDTALKEIVKPLLSNASIPIISWKELI